MELKIQKDELISCYGRRSFPARILAAVSTILLVLAVFAQDKAPVTPVDTRTKPIEKQRRQVFSLDQDGVYFSNAFDGARLNKIERTGENRYTILVTPVSAQEMHTSKRVFGWMDKIARYSRQR